MTDPQLYMATVFPQWGIFIGIALVIVGYVDKKEKWAYAGWSLFVATGLTALYFNLWGGIAPEPGIVPSDRVAMLLTTGWLTALGGLLALATLLFLYFKLKRYAVLAVLTILFFIVVFFQYNSLIRTPEKESPKTEQSNPLNN